MIGEIWELIGDSQDLQLQLLEMMPANYTSVVSQASTGRLMKVSNYVYLFSTINLLTTFSVTVNQYFAGKSYLLSEIVLPGNSYIRAFAEYSVVLISQTNLTQMLYYFPDYRNLQIYKSFEILGQFGTITSLDFYNDTIVFADEHQMVTLKLIDYELLQDGY